MQTFLPYPDFVESARALDTKRLMKQTVETYQLILVFTELKPVKDESGATITFESRVPRGWTNHPMAKMWRGHELALSRYQAACGAELRTRLTKSGRPYAVSSVIRSNWALWHAIERGWEPSTELSPAWLGRDDVHGSHRGNLLRKDPIFYGQYGWTDDPESAYVWPVGADGVHRR